MSKRMSINCVTHDQQQQQQQQQRHLHIPTTLAHTDSKLIQIPPSLLDKRKKKTFRFRKKESYSYYRTQECDSELGINFEHPSSSPQHSRSIYI